MADSAIADLKDSRVPPVLYWSQTQVGDWIDGLGLQQYRCNFYLDVQDANEVECHNFPTCFEENNINGRKLIMVTSSRLPDIGITDFDHIKIITKELRTLLELEEPFWNRSIALPPRNDLGMYLEMKAVNGQTKDPLTYQQFLDGYENPLWKPHLNNHCQLLPQQ